MLYQGLVPYITVHKGTTPTSFDTWGRLILDIAIASYSTTTFLYSFSLFYSTGETAARYKPGPPPLHQAVGNVKNGSPLRSASSNTRKGRYGKLSVVDTMEANTWLFHPNSLILWFLTRMPLTFYQLIPRGAEPCTQRHRGHAAGPCTHPGLT